MDGRRTGDVVGGKPEGRSRKDEWTLTSLMEEEDKKKKKKKKKKKSGKNENKERRKEVGRG